MTCKEWNGIERSIRSASGIGGCASGGAVEKEHGQHAHKDVVSNIVPDSKKYQHKY